MVLNASYGAYVVDRVASDPDLAVVINRPGVEARDWDTKRGESTVAADNPQYPARDEVLVVVYESDLHRFDTDWDSFSGTDRSLTELANAGVPYYAFPRQRLKQAPDELLQDEIEPTPETANLLSRLEESGLDCHLEDSETIICTKLGKEYRLQPGGLLSGDGVLSSKLDSLAKQYA